MFFCNFVFFCFLPFFRGVFRTLKTCLKQVQSTVKHCGKNMVRTPPPKTGKKPKLAKSHKIVFLGYFGGGGGGGLKYSPKGVPLGVFWPEWRFSSFWAKTSMGLRALFKLMLGRGSELLRILFQIMMS